MTFSECCIFSILFVAGMVGIVLLLDYLGRTGHRTIYRVMCFLMGVRP